MPGNSSDLRPVPAPANFPDINQLIVLGGAYVSKIDRLSLFSPNQFEAFTYEWAHYSLKEKYKEVSVLGGSGDLGRDIICWKDSATRKPRHWDNYQCKHYKDKIAPSDFWVEIGKLVYYTYKKEFTVPDLYYVVSTKGVGPTLNKLFSQPDKLKKQFFEAWNTYCKDKITTTESLELEDELLKYADQFDYSIFKELPILELLDQHREHCPSHRQIFGEAIKKRGQPKQPPSTVAPIENKYVTKLYDVYTEETGNRVRKPEDISSNKRLNTHFSQARKCFYCAESLKEFARDNLPSQNHFEELTSQFFDGIINTILDNHPTSFRRLTEVCKTAQSLQIDSNVLVHSLVQADRIGICHHLANEDRVSWVNDD